MSAEQPSSPTLAVQAQQAGTETAKPKRTARPKRPRTAKPTVPEIAPEELPVVIEVVRKQLATLDLHSFVQQAWHIVEPDEQFVDNWHIQAICQHLEAVADGRIKQIVINVPPGTMKSLLVCVFWPAWVWTHSPGKRFMFSSYADALSQRDSIRCRNVITSEWYQKNWGIVFKDDVNTRGLYENQFGGWRLATSVMGKGTGLHPDFNFTDDPHNVQKAESDTDRRGVIEWWDGTMSSRGVSRNVAQGCIMQRLHSQDLSAHLLEKGTWTHICLPMYYEAPVKMSVGGQEVSEPRMKPTLLGFQDPRTTDGELLWPELFPATKVKQMELRMGIYHAAGQMQQRPSPRGGGMFKREWFTKILTVLPDDLVQGVRYWDKAGTQGGDGARTAGSLVFRRASGRFLVVDVVKGRWGAVEREAVIKSTTMTDAATYGHGIVTWVEQEPGSGGLESAEATVRNLAGFDCQIERVSGAKEIRAEPFASQCSVGNVDLMLGPWTDEFIEECTLFPMGKLKDQVDSTGGAFNKLALPQIGWTAEAVKQAAVGDPLSQQRQAGGWQPPPRVFTPRRLF